MTEIIQRGKQQILFNYLPGRTFDFNKSVFARITNIRGNTNLDLNNKLVIRKIAEQVRVWSEDFRPLLRNTVIQDESNFVLIDPKHVDAEIYPLVFWCSNNKCQKVFDYSRNNQIPRTKICPTCNTGKLVQLRFIKTHKCGNIEPLTPPLCKNCRSNEIALDDRGSERFSNFRWRCLNCGQSQTVFPGKCTKCNLPHQNPSEQNMEIEVLRANRTFYAHSVTLINIPQKKYSSFFNTIDWYAISTAKYLGFENLVNININDYASHLGTTGRSTLSVSDIAFGQLLDALNNGRLSVKEYSDEIKRIQNQANPSIEDLKSEITIRSGIDNTLWEEAKYNIIDSIIPYELGTRQRLQENDAVKKASSLGISELNLIDNFPIIIASYGYSRIEYTPNNCQLNPFPSDREQGGRYPIFVDKVQADAILFKLNPIKVINWIRINGFEIELPNGTNEECSAKGYFIRLFHNVNVRKITWLSLINSSSLISNFDKSV